MRGIGLFLVGMGTALLAGSFAQAGTQLFSSVLGGALLAVGAIMVAESSRV